MGFDSLQWMPLYMVLRDKQPTLVIILEHGRINKNLKRVNLNVLVSSSYMYWPACFISIQSP